jgi:hypothetical protein
VIPALAGREGEVIWGLTERHTKNDNQIYETWATERAGYRGSTSSDAEYVKSWLNLDQMSGKEIEGVRDCPCYSGSTSTDFVGTR